MADAERLDKVEERLGAVEKGVEGLRGEVGTLSGEVQKLRVLGEETSRQIKKVAEVQTLHGERLDETRQMVQQIVAGEIAPFRDLTRAVREVATNTAPLLDFMKRIAEEHDARLQDLEKKTGIRQ